MIKSILMPAKYSGLTHQEAKNRLQQYGKNELIDVNKVSALKILLRQIKQNYIVYLLLAAALLSFFVDKDITGYTLLVVIFVVIFTGFIQEYKAEKAVSALKNMLMPVSFVVRDSKKIEVPSNELVPGDIILLRNGEKIPADSKILEQNELRVDEAVLTGESEPVSKVTSQEDTLDHKNTVYMGSYIVNGKCTAEVIHTGMDTKFGKIAEMISTAEKELPLQQKLNVISKYLVITGITMAIAMALLVVLQTPVITDDVITDVLVLAIAVAVSSFPEGLPVVLITALSVGASRMAKKNAIVNRMSIIEALGEATIICSDKTGTITKGETTVKFLYSGDRMYEVTGAGFNSNGVFKDLGTENKIEPKEIYPLKLLLQASVLCNDSEISRTGDGHEFEVRGTPTEGALRIMSAKANMYKSDFTDERIEERPFNSDRKMMSVMVEHEGEYYVFAKGAPEILISHCTSFQRDGHQVDLNESEIKKINKFNSNMTSEALRTLAVVYKKLNYNDKDYAEEGFTFLGLVAMEDPPREEAKIAIQQCKDAGIKVKMITGDNKETALAIGKQVGLDGRVLEGYELDGLSDHELHAVIEEITIFARVKPEHKLRLIKLLKERGEIVAMTGDGVNDAPALKEAHIGIAMGKNGTDVSRSVADLTLKDDNFATIVHAISEGRTVFKNIRKFVTYQLSCNIAVLIVLFAGVLAAPTLGWLIPIILGLQILLMNLVTDNMPAITLGVNPTSKDIMKEHPRHDASILNKSLFYSLMSAGLIMGSLTLVVLYVNHNILGYSFEASRTAAVVTLILLQISAAFSYRSFRKKVLTRTPFVNPYLFYASFASIVIMLLVVYTPLNLIFDTTPLSFKEWFVPILTTFIGLLIFDLKKVIDNRFETYRLETR